MAKMNRTMLASLFFFTASCISASAAEEPFSVKSPSINVGCDSTGSASVEYSPPAGAKIIQANARWIAQASIKGSDAKVTERKETIVKASGTITGLDKNIFKDCPAGGHATLELFGKIMK